jgi:beta-galactosidase
MNRRRSIVLTPLLLMVAIFARAKEPATFLAQYPPADAHWTSSTATRLSVCLNGLWRFVPAGGDDATPPGGPYGRIPVPGSWTDRYSTAVREADGYKPDFGQLGHTVRAWFRRDVDVPADMAGRQIVLELKEVGRLARVWVGGKDAGVVDAQGRVDITPHVVPGHKADIAILVSATSTALPKKPAAAATPDNVVKHRGLIGDVLLAALPQGPQVEAMAIRTSVSQDRWQVLVDLRGLKAGQAYSLQAQALDADGKPAAELNKHFKGASLAATVDLSGGWQRPHLWEPSDPFRYRCVVRLRNADGMLLDEYTDDFGFREFGIDGGDFRLNGRKIRLRPMLVWGMWEPMRYLCPIVLRAEIAGYQAEGFNTLQYWPSNFPQALEHLAAECDRAGMLLILPLESMVNRSAAFAGGTPDPLWLAEVRRQVLLVGNHPSVIMWGVSPNSFDTRRWPHFVKDEPVQYPYARDKRKGAAVALAAHHAIDPTRPAFFHGSDAGDVSTPNLYLNMMPLAEQKEFPSLWAEHKDFPLMMIECGVPFSSTLCRWKHVGFPAARGAPFATEYAATNLGPRAYELETDGYVNQIAAKFQGNELYSEWFGGDTPTCQPQFLPVSAEFVRQRWRAWRTWGISGGMLPWEFDRLAYDKPQFFTPESARYIPLGPRAVPGIWPDTVAEGDLVPWTVSTDPQRPQWSKAYTPVGQALKEVNGPVLAWIGGPGRDHCDATHNYYGGQTLHRDVIAVYDGDTPGNRQLGIRWTATQNETQIAHAAARLAIPPGGDVRLPIALVLPTVPTKQRGRIELRLDGKLVDAYPFTVFPSRRPPAAGTLRLYDPQGLTAEMLKKRGISFTAWDGTFTAGDVLLIGRQALTQGKSLDIDLAQAMQQGLRAVLFAQDVDFWETRMHWRTSWHVSREFFRTGGAELAGLCDDDLAKWRSRGTLLGERDDFPLQVAQSYPPPAPIWHWGNANAVASIALEKPHYGNFTPLLEGEFDLAFSPLLELRYGQGLLAICQLNLEENAAVDPAADAALDAVLAMVRRPLPAPQLVVFDSAHARQCRECLARGGNVLVSGCKSEQELHAAAAALQLKVETKTARLRGSTSLPRWPELRGVGASDLHWRGFLDVPVLTSVEGGETGADGLLARVTVGKGTVLFCQAHPDMFPVDAERTALQRPDFPPRGSPSGSKTYFRLSRWHAQRLLSQLANNLGASACAQDEAFLHALAVPFQPPATFDLAGQDWLCIADGSRQGETKKFFAPDADLALWTPASVPHDLKPAAGQTVQPWKSAGSAWFRKGFTLPAAQAGKELTLVLWVDAEESVFAWINGRELVRSAQPRRGFSRLREYIVPAGLLREKNVLAIEVINAFGLGGLPHGPLRLEARQSSPYYHSDYDADDNPFLWYPW